MGSSQGSFSRCFLRSVKEGIKVSELIMDSLTLKARIGDNDEGFDWLHHYLSTHVPLSTSHSLVDKIDPYSLRTTLVSWGKDVLGGYKDNVKVSIVPTTGKMQLVKFENRTIKMGIIRSDDWAFDMMINGL
ncbi:hypothetical protein L486_05268 [Kwoniella mangroviensis CBS 10435]|uniref:EthD domain-containing protein n=1 Tax=Kwoniella mangroviensis CBS 10435 TaxID=1331196 RepID=A0A1B9IQH8_9TREE|nr:hypothetical protein L486_05268 [Kwoniella mangroviensis CBS 10435]